jgi:hypothetical protein
VVEHLVAVLVPDVDVRVLFLAFHTWLLDQVLPVASPADLTNVPRAVATVNCLKARVPGPIRTRAILAV